MLDTLPHLTLALALATLFASAAAHKLHARERWPAVLRQYRLLPEVLVAPVAALLPLTEALAAAALLWPRTSAAGALFIAALLLAYAYALAINLRRGRTSIDCGCLGAQRRRGIAPWMVGRNLLLAAAALALLLPTDGRGARCGASPPSRWCSWSRSRSCIRCWRSSCSHRRRASMTTCAPAARGSASRSRLWRAHCRTSL